SSANVRIVPFSLPAMRPFITPSPEALTLNANSPMRITGPVNGAPARKLPLTANPNLPLTPALVQDGEPCATQKPPLVAPGFPLTDCNPAEVTTAEKGCVLPSFVVVPVTVQFEATS